MLEKKKNTGFYWVWLTRWPQKAALGQPWSVQFPHLLPCRLTQVHCTLPDHPDLPVFSKVSFPCLSLISHCQLGPGPQWSSCHLLTTLMVMMWNSDLDLTGSYAAAAGIQHCSMCHVPINHGFRPGSAAYYDLKQIRYWIRANIIPSFKPSQTLAPTSLIHKEILCTPSSLPLQHSLFLLGCSASYPSISLHPLYEISEHAYWSI